MNKRKKLFGMMLLAAGMIFTGCGVESNSQNTAGSGSDKVQDSTTQIQNTAGSDFLVEFINVGKADSTLIKVEDKAYLIDTGTKSSVSAITAALEEQGIEKLDGVFLTHKHSDHIGGLKKLSKAYPIETVYSAELSMDEENGENKIDSLVEELGLNHVKLIAGDTVQISSNLALEVIGPITYNAKDDNDNSLVMRLKVNGKVFLFTGDMQFAEEASLLAAGADLSADVLKVGNHGNPDATSQAFAEAVSPEVTVISTDTSVDTDSANERVQKLFENSRILITQDYEMGIKIRIDEARNLVIEE